MSSLCRSRPRSKATSHRYADGRVTPDGRLWIGVRERHDEGERSRDVVNELVAIPTDGSAEPQIIAGGRDFYSNPRISPDGTHLSFLAWNLPWMPWDGCELFAAELAPDGTLENVTQVAGRDGEESIWQPEWSPDGELVFASDRSGWWNLERVRDGERSVLYAAEAEFGYPAWVFGLRSFAFLGDGRIFSAYDRAAGRSSRCSTPRRARSRSSSCRTTRCRARPWPRRARPSSSSPARRRSRREIVRLDVSSGVDGDAAAERPGARGPLALLPAAGDRVPDRERPHRACALLPAREPRVRRAGR